LCAYRNGKGDEDDEHGIFNCGGTVIALTELDQTQHFRSPWGIEYGSIARGSYWQCHSTNAERNQGPSTHCPAIRQKTVRNENLLDF
jgi:hypothetical protein